MAGRHSGFFLQSKIAVIGNFEIVAPSRRGGLVHLWRDNNAAGFPWSPPEFFGSGYPDGVSLIERSGGNLEALVRSGDRLAIYRRQDGKWQEPVYFGSFISGPPALIESNGVTGGRYEVVAPRQGGGLAHYWRNSADPPDAWNEPVLFAERFGQFESVALIQSNYGAGNLEIVARVRNGNSCSLLHFWREPAEGSPWSWPSEIPMTGLTDGCMPVGLPAFLQSRYGNLGNFELVTSLSTGGSARFSRDNDTASLPWSLSEQIGSGELSDVSLIQSSFGNLELVCRNGNRYEHFWHEDQTMTWHGPYPAWEEKEPDLAVEGEWRVPCTAPVVGIHAAVLHTGKVLLFSYLSEDAQDWGDSCLFDPESGAVTKYPPLPKDPFCGGHAFLPDGSLLVAGGHASGLEAIHAFTPGESGGAWQQLPDMPEARWYPTCTALADGRVLILSGTKDSGPQPEAELNATCEVYSSDGGLTPPVTIPFLDEIAPVSIYPFVFLLPNGKLFVHGWNKTAFLDPSNWSEDGTRVLTRRSEPRNYPVQGTAVLLPLLPDSDPPYRPRILLIGGGGVPPSTTMPATETCEMLDLGAEPWEWQWAAPLSCPRVMGDAVLLPDGTVLVMNGSTTGWSDDANSPVFEVQLYEPGSGTWTAMCTARVPRLYHATALLLPDGRVMTAGTDEAFNIEPYKKSELRIEFFSPPYLFRGSRPVISDAPEAIRYGEAFSVGTPDAGAIVSAALLRPGAATHSFNMEQRHVGLLIQERDTESLSLAAPPNGNIAPPGYYMLFLISDAGVPSVARFVRLS